MVRRQSESLDSPIGRPIDIHSQYIANSNRHTYIILTHHASPCSHREISRGGSGACVMDFADPLNCQKTPTLVICSAYSGVEPGMLLCSFYINMRYRGGISPVFQFSTALLKRFKIMCIYRKTIVEHYGFLCPVATVFFSPMLQRHPHGYLVGHGYSDFQIQKYVVGVISFRRCDFFIPTPYTPRPIARLKVPKPLEAYALYLFTLFHTLSWSRFCSVASSFLTISSLPDASRTGCDDSGHVAGLRMDWYSLWPTPVAPYGDP